MPSDFHTKLLRKQASDDEYRYYVAGLEWDLIDPIIIENQQDFKSEPKWRDRLQPYSHQVANLITFCRRLPVTLLADDVGLGKTISAGLVVTELMARGRLEHTLIVCPKLLGPQWKEELDTKFDVPSVIAIGKDLKTALPEEPGAVITTYQSARMYLDEIPHDRFQMLVLDEAHKLRNLYGVEKPPQVATTFRNALEARRFRFVLMLTATPIHNRLWDLYSLVDLLTVARGHKNPFGSEGMFARKFIADNRESARHLKADSKDEFRSIVYGYMSRVRRGDAKLYFPERVVLMHKAIPTAAELLLIDTVGRSISKMNRLAQISILQALSSSPDALRAQLNNMSANGTVPQELAVEVGQIVAAMPLSAKLTALGALIDGLSAESPDKWRVVVFTGRVETQTTIQAFLEQRELKVGIINGSSGSRNQETIRQFRSAPPLIRVIVSTEAGSEGVNLQVANVLVNFDLPWNPMIVEQRIGRVQRLASEHAKVSIYNVILKGTFEEYIVGRLMEKLQMASHAIGDIESLLDATGLNDDDENGDDSFNEKIRRLVVAALEGKDVEAAARREDESIMKAKETLQREEHEIDEMLGSMDGKEYVGPRAPKLAKATPTTGPAEFVEGALTVLGAKVTRLDQNLVQSEENGGVEFIRFSEPPIEDKKTTLYAPGTPAFQRLVDRITASGVHDVADVDDRPGEAAAAVTRSWVEGFGGKTVSIKAEEIRRCFRGESIIRVRATVAHDSYERLIKVRCDPMVHNVKTDAAGLGPLQAVLEDPVAIGLRASALNDTSDEDPSVSEFVRFYKERREQETKQAGDDERKRKRLEEEFTPHLDKTLVAAKGQVHRALRIRVQYELGGKDSYTDTFVVVPSTREIAGAPTLDVCSQSGRRVPVTCLEACQMSGVRVLRHLLLVSEKSGRRALPQFTVRCSVTGKTLLGDEVGTSAVSGAFVDLAVLKTSAVSGKRAEPANVDRCAFTGVEALRNELLTSDVSGKLYRIDEQERSAVSERTGHRTELIKCAESGQWLIPSEGEQCAVTGKRVMPGILEKCEITGKRVLPSLLKRCSVTGKHVLESLLVESSISNERFLEQMAVRSRAGKYCMPAEAKQCAWSGRPCHPDDVRECALTGLTVFCEFVTAGEKPRLQVLVDLLNGTTRAVDEQGIWATVEARLPPEAAKGRVRVDAAVMSPDKKRIAAAIEVKAMLGFRVSWEGLIFSLEKNEIVGRIAQGKRTASGWQARQS